jgi:hypothetical protein
MCAICDLDIDFGVEHPMTLSVAVATRQAIEAGLLAAPDAEEGAVGIMKQRLKAVAALTAVQKRLEQTLTREAMAALPDFFVLVIESGTWGFFRPTFAGFDPNARPEAPRLTAEDPTKRDAVVIVSEAAARRISAGELPFADAADRGLVVVDADHERREALTAAWRAAYPQVGFSRFVCA